MLSVNRRSLDRGLWEETWDARDDVLGVRLLADLDLATETLARRRLTSLADDDAVRRLFFTAGASRFVDLRGLDLLLDASRRMRDRGRWLIVVDPPTSLCLMTKALRLAGQLRLAATVRQAMALVGES